jgi:ATP-dependent Clp protease adaptor protein ClpS
VRLISCLIAWSAAGYGPDQVAKISVEPRNSGGVNQIAQVSHCHFDALPVQCDRPVSFEYNTDMSQSAAAAEVEVEVERTDGAHTTERGAAPNRSKPKLLPPYAVVVLNDDLHTFDYVMLTFQKVFGYAPERCFQLAKQIHEQGRAIVWTGPKEVAELKRDLVRSAGPDIFASTKVDWPLGCEIEPLPG